MKTEKEIKEKIQYAKKLWAKNPHFWGGYREALEWVLDMYIHIEGCRGYSLADTGGIKIFDNIME